MPGFREKHTASRAVHRKSLTSSLLLLTLIPVVVLAGLWGLAATVLVLQSQTEGNAGRSGELLFTAAVGTIVAGAVLVVTSLIAWRFSHSLGTRLARLRRETLEYADKGLPQLVDRLIAGDTSAPSREEQDRSYGDDELGRLATATAHLRHTVATAVAEQARGREGSEQVFLGLARRTQVLITRLIPKLDELERKHQDSDLLKDIFVVDHLATRVRRHTENLVILGGAPPVRRWSKAVPIYEVLRSAISETEDYRRVDAQPAPQVSLVGPAVADVVHLLAELIENGTAFSPPETKVSVSATHVANGLALEVEDRGLGMPEQKYVQLNRLLEEPPRVDMMSLGETPRLGLFVVARLARRHNLEVSLRRSHYGGTLAIVLLPRELLEETTSLLSHLIPDRSHGAAEGNTPQPAPAQPFVDAEAVSDMASPGLTPPVSSPAPASPPALPPEPARAPAPAPAAKTEMTVPATPGDQDGFPAYGGAGLLPSTPNGPAADEAGAAAPEQHPASLQHTAPRQQAAPEQPPVPEQHPAPPPHTSTPQHTSPPEHTSPAQYLPAEPGYGPAAEPEPPRDPGPAEMSTPGKLPTRVRGENLAEPLRRSGHAWEERTGPVSPDRAGAAIGAIQSANKRARGSMPPPPAGGRETPADGPGDRTGSQES